MAIHIAESEMESRLVERGDGPFADGLRGRGIDVSPRAGSPVRLLAQLGVLDLRPLLIHCIRVDDEDIATIARLKSPVVHCPVSNAKLGHGIAPVPEMLAAGVILGLGSDSMASNNRMDVLEEARYAILAQRLRLRHHEVLTAHDALELATVGGATVLGLNDRIGSLDAGKDADLAAFPIGGHGPVHDPETAAVMSLGGTPATFVAVRGRVLRDGPSPDPDPGLASRVERAAAALREWLDSGGELEPPPSADTR
jgi:5-methylthioadenosine/S-adenosylhomocysteine deaminase